MLDPGAFRHLDLNEDLRSVRLREELLLQGAHAEHRREEDRRHSGHNEAFVVDGACDQSAKLLVVGRPVDRLVTALDRLDRGQHLHAEIGRERTGHQPGDHQGEEHDPEDVAGVLTGAGWSEPDWHQANRGDESAG